MTIVAGSQRGMERSHQKSQRMNVSSTDCGFRGVARSLLTGIVLLMSFVAAQAQSVVSPAAVDAILSEVNQPGMPGCTVGVVERGQLTISRSAGLADVENNVAINDETRFDIGSMSKQFLAMAVLILASEGKIVLNEDVHRYVPELPTYPWRITLNNLLHHTSGLKDYDQLLQLAGWVDGDVKSLHDVLWIVERQKSLAFKPGTRYMYSDTNYFLLGFIAQRVTGKPVDLLLREMIFDPLGMRHTSLRTDRWLLVPHKAWPYVIREGKPRLYINGEEPLGDGGIFSTVGDLALWEGNFEDAKVGGRKVIEEMQEVEPVSDGTANDYAAGLYIRSYSGIRMVEHSGTSYGYQAEKLRFPEQRLSIIVLCNRRDGSYVRLSNHLADLFLSRHPAGEEKPAYPQSAKSELDRLAGVYFSDSAADGVLLEVRKGVLFDAGEDREYRQTGPLIFESSSAETLCRCSTKYTFQLGSDGKGRDFVSTTPSGSGNGTPAKAVYVRMSPGRTAIRREYLGEYVSEELATSWCVLQKGDTVFVRRRGFSDRPSRLLWDDAVDAPGGILQFQREGDGVVGFSLRNIRLNSMKFQKLAPGQHPLPAPYTCP